MSNNLDETIAFFVAAFEGASVDAVRTLVTAHTNARGETDTEAIMAGLESLTAPKIEPTKTRELKIERRAAAAATAGPLKMTLKPVMDGGFVGTINVSSDTLATLVNAKTKQSENKVKMCFIIDRSGSMGTSFERLLKKILPPFMQKIGVPHEDHATVIAFDHTLQVQEMTRRDMQQSRLVAGGRTYMAPAVKAAAREILQHHERPVRLLVLTDGALHDQDQTVDEAGKLAMELRGRCRINCQAVRFYTSSSEPDTRGVCSCLALNTVSEAQLIDLSAAQSDEALIDALFEAFDGDGLDMCAEVEANEAIMTHNPWDLVPSKALALKPGINYLWFKTVPKDLKIKAAVTGQASTPIDFEVSSEPVSLADIGSSLKPLMDSYVARLKVLKVVNTPATIEEMKSILEYFERFESFLQSSTLSVSELAQNKGIRQRIEYFRQMAIRRRQSLFGLMCEVANDDKVAKLSAAQQADYLRQVGGPHRNAKALARRAIGAGLDFAGTLHKEIRDMKEHMAELANIDDSEHAVSFYSMESTLGGIKALCSFDDEALELMEATDLIQIANIVGVPCSAPIGDFVDAMSYRVNELLPGSFLSLSDVLVAHVQSKGKALTAPGFPEVEITNVIPVFDDPRIQRFLQKYAPSLLSYTTSIGMRRVIADVEGTYAYTIAAALWKMIQVLSANPTQGNISLFVRFAHDFHQAIHGNFNYLLDFVGDANTIKNHNDPGMCFFVNNNGITNITDVILQCTNPTMMAARPDKQGTQAEVAALGMENMPRILRTIYSFEVYQVVRKIFKREEDQEPFIQKQLHELLGIDLTKNATPLQPLFDNEPKPADRTHYNQYVLNNTRFDEILKSMWYVDYLALLPAALGAISKDDPVAYFRENFRPKSPEVICNALGLVESNGLNAEQTLRRYAMCNIIQGFTSPTKADRVDTDARKMKTVDLGVSYEVQEKFLRDYVESQFANQYRKDCVEKLKQEKKEIVVELLRELIHATTMDQFCNALVNGKKKGTLVEVIKDACHQGFAPLKKALENLTKDVPLRLRKLAVITLGHDENDEPIFNGGNVIFKGMEEVEETFIALGENNQLEQLRLRYRQFLKHNYRENGMPNRHTHCTDKTSYFALGFATLEEYAKAVTEKEFKLYCRLHWSCCGIPQTRGLITRRKERKGLQPPTDAIFPRNDPRFNDKNDGDDQ